MSENLNKEMEEVVEDTLEEETPAHKSVKGKGGVVAPVTTPESQQKDKSGVKQAKQPAAGVAYKEEVEVEEETETEAEELEESLPRLKSEMMDGMVKHMKKMKLDDKMYIEHMIPHHQVAVDMSKVLLKNTKRDFMIYLA